MLGFQILNLTSPTHPMLGGLSAVRRADQLNFSDPEAFSCVYHLLYVRGGLVFIEGTSNASQANLWVLSCYPI